jgi:hypothetical protein
MYPRLMSHDKSHSVKYDLLLKSTKHEAQIRPWCRLSDDDCKTAFQCRESLGLQTSVGLPATSRGSRSIVQNYHIVTLSVRYTDKGITTSSKLSLYF